MIVSADGNDTANCGKSNSCRTIDFAITHRAADNDIIKINNIKLSKDPRPFLIHGSFSMFRNITLIGFNGRPVISSQTDLFYRHRSSYFFEEKNLEGNKSITLQMKNLILRGIGIARFTEFSSSSKIFFENSHFENITTSKEIIHFEVSPNKLHAISVYFKHCNFTNNVAENRSSIINIKHCNNVFNKCSFMNNLSAGKGSISLTGVNSLFENSYFEKNIAMNGGALYAFGSSVIESLNCSFRENNARFYGGAIFTSGKSLIIKQSSFEGNTVSGRSGLGGAIFLHAATFCSISGSNFTKNKAKMDGGAVYHSREKFNDSYIGPSTFNNLTEHTKLFAHSEIHQIALMQSTYYTTEQKFYGKSLSKSIFDQNIKYRINERQVFPPTLYSKPSTEQNFPYQKGFYTTNQAKDEGKLLVKMSLLKNNIAEYGGGGAVYSYDSPHFTILNSSFIENKAKLAGGAVVNYRGKLKIKTSLFKSNNAPIGGAIASVTGKNSTISESSFVANEAKLMGGAIHFNNGSLRIKSSSFSRNRANQGGTIFYSLYGQTLAINSSSFIGNDAANGGTIFFAGKRLLVTSSVFDSNTAHGPGGEGGALNLQHDKRSIKSKRGKISITHCIFHGNLASFRGGAIFADSWSLQISHSLFQSSPYPHNESYFGGEFIYSFCTVTLEHTSFKDVDSYNAHNSLIIHVHRPNVAMNLTFKTDVYIKCLSGKNIEMLNKKTRKHNHPNSFEFLEVSCSLCPKNLYSLSAGHIYSFLSNNSVEKKQIKCKRCPFGGNCDKGKIQATEAFWGYVSEEEIRFNSCPFRYCCSGKECKNYSSCHTGRTGTLCGTCEKGLTENLMNADCLEHTSCEHPWYWLVIAIAGIIYLIMLVYLDQMAKAVKVLLIPSYCLNHSRSSYKDKLIIIWSKIGKQIRSVRQKLSLTGKIQVLTDDVYIEVLGGEETTEEVKATRNEPELQRHEKMQEVISSQQAGEVNFFAGLLKIIIFFYQTNVLFKVHTGSKSCGFAYIFQDTVYTLFNLRVNIDGVLSHNLSWCPLENLRPVSKVLLKASFIVYLFILLLFAFTLLKIGRLLRIIHTVNNKLMESSRLFHCSLRLILISYAGITATCFSLLSCVEFHNLGTNLFIDGSIRCYTWWQNIILFVVFCWVVPFPLAIYAASQMIHNRILSVSKLFPCILFPIPTICYWFYTCISSPKRNSQASSDSFIVNKSIQKALETLEGPFRKMKGTNASTSLPLSWESIIILRKLLLISLKTFVIHTFFRLFSMLLCTALFLIHHVKVQPFSSNLLNIIESISLTMLIIIGLLNILPAYNYIYPTYFYVEIKGIIGTLSHIETIVNLAFPFIIILFLSIFTCIRFFQFLLLLYQAFVKLIRYCSRYNKYEIVNYDDDSFHYIDK